MDLSHSDTLIATDHKLKSDDENSSSRSLSPITFPPNEPAKIRIKSSHLRRRRSRSHSASNPGLAPMPPSPHTRAWYEFDLAVVVALVSPVGNWLTGGDHVKNILIIALLIFYLHQIIEVPWELYQKARPRRPSDPTTTSPESTNNNNISTLAASELHSIEFLFLFLATLSPILGALLLRYVTVTLLGDNTTAAPVSWFSTSLFVLATGVRPWTHLVDRVAGRTGDLHAVVHYPVPPSPFAFPASEEYKREVEGMKKEVGELRRRVGELSRVVEGMRGGVVGELEGVYSYVDEAVGAVQRAVRRAEQTVGKVEGRVVVVEGVVEDLGKPRETKGEEERKTSVSSVLFWFIPSWVPFLPHTSKASPAPSTLPTQVPTPSRPRSKPTSTSSPPRSLRSSSSLATILEEEHAHAQAHAQSNGSTSGGSVHFDDDKRLQHRSKGKSKSKSNDGVKTAVTARARISDHDDEHEMQDGGAEEQEEEGEQGSEDEQGSSDSDYDQLSESGTSEEEEEEVRYTLGRSPAPRKANPRSPNKTQTQTQTQTLPALALYALTFPLRVLGRVVAALGGR